MAKKRRVLLKLSGEAFGAGSLGVNPDVVSEIAKSIASAAKDVEIAIVVGGGNFFRGAELSNRGMDRGRADYMGMLGTVMNALALQDFIEHWCRSWASLLLHRHSCRSACTRNPCR